MKELALSMSTSRTYQVSFALVIFAVVIFLGISGLFVVVIHRQKRKKQLKALLRAKNLGPVLESREIAQNTGKENIDIVKPGLWKLGLWKLFLMT